jgi:serine/threonine protein kinase
MIPETLLHYRILQPLGSGGMGDVYLAEDTKLGRRVALKVLPRGRADDPEQRQRFEREARAVAALNHPNIVTIHAVEQADTVTFLTMELVDGKTLSQLIPKGGLPVDRLLKLAIPLIDAVAAAHDRGITHRDLKPANVMVASDGRLKVLDFGLAKLREVADTNEVEATALKPDPLTGEGRIVGTVAYMSPEQAEGKSIDHRSDIFSLGVVLYEMATGDRPFKGDTNVSVLSSILRDAPPSVTEINRSLPRDLARIIKRALVKDPEHRYQTAKDLRNDLETLEEEIESGEVQASSAAAMAPATSPPPVTSSSRLPVLVLSAVIGLALIAGGVWLTRNDAIRPSEPAKPPFENLKLTRLTSSGKVGLSAISADGRYVVHSVNDGAKASLWLRQVATTSNVQIVPPEVVRYDGLSFSPDGNFVYYTAYPATQNISTVYQIPVLGGAPRKLIDDVDTPLAFSPDGKQFAFIRGYQSKGENILIVAAADGTNERHVVVHKNPLSFALNNVAWSPDGSTLVSILFADAQFRARLSAVNVASGAETVIGKIWQSIQSVGWTADGKGLVIAATEDAPGASSQIWYVAFPSGEARRITNDLNNYGGVTLTGNGSTIATVQREQLSHVWVTPIGDPAQARQITTGTGRTDGGGGLAWTPDSRVVYTSDASGNADIWITDTTGRQQTQLTVDPAHDVLPQVTPDGRSVVFVSQRAGGSIWRMDTDGGNQRVMVTDPSAFFPIVSSDSKWLYFASFVQSPRQVWRMPLDGGTPERLTAPWEGQDIKTEGVFYHPTITLADISPDGTQALAYYTDAARRGWRAGLFPIAPGQPKPLEIFGPDVTWAPDGKSLFYLDATGEVPNVVRLSLAGGPSSHVTSFTSDGVFNFAISPDGKQLALSRGTVTSDVVLMRTGQ